MSVDQENYIDCAEFLNLLNNPIYLEEYVSQQPGKYLLQNSNKVKRKF